MRGGRRNREILGSFAGANPAITVLASLQPVGVINPWFRMPGFMAMSKGLGGESLGSVTFTYGEAWGRSGNRLEFQVCAAFK